MYSFTAKYITASFLQAIQPLSFILVERCVLNFENFTVVAFVVYILNIYFVIRGAFTNMD